MIHNNYNKSDSRNEATYDNLTLYSWKENWDGWVNKYIAPGIKSQDFELMVDQLDSDIFQFPLFTEAFCQEFIVAAEEKAQWTEQRHDYFPTNDVLLTDLGLEAMYHAVMGVFCHPVARLKWQLKGKRWVEQMQEESFLVRYRAEDQQSLSIHGDYSDYTFTVGLNANFTGGGTWFPRQQVLANPKGGDCTLFPSITHPHGGRPTLTGTRYIIVSFCRRPNLYLKS